MHRGALLETRSTKMHAIDASSSCVAGEDATRTGGNCIYKFGGRDALIFFTCDTVPRRSVGRAVHSGFGPLQGPGVGGEVMTRLLRCGYSAPPAAIVRKSRADD